MVPIRYHLPGTLKHQHHVSPSLAIKSIFNRCRGGGMGAEHQPLQLGSTRTIPIPFRAPLAAKPGQTWGQQCKSENERKCRKTVSPFLKNHTQLFLCFRDLYWVQPPPLFCSRLWVLGFVLQQRWNTEKFRDGRAELDVFNDFLYGPLPWQWWSKCWWFMYVHHPCLHSKSHFIWSSHSEENLWTSLSKA